MADEVKQIDKSSWGPGPWQSEPDDVWWLGFDCVCRAGEAACV